MIKNILIVSLLFFLNLNCNHRVIEEIPNKTYIGILVVVGNEPFTSFALDDGEGHITILKQDKNLDNFLNKLQGNKVEVTGFELPKEQGIKVSSVKIYKKKAE